MWRTRAWEWMQTLRRETFRRFRSLSPETEALLSRASWGWGAATSRKAQCIANCAVDETRGEEYPGMGRGGQGWPFSHTPHQSTHANGAGAARPSLKSHTKWQTEGTRQGAGPGKRPGESKRVISAEETGSLREKGAPEVERECASASLTAPAAPGPTQ